MIRLYLSASSGGVSIASFATAIGSPAGMTGNNVILVFSFGNGIAEKFYEITLSYAIT